MTSPGLTQRIEAELAEGEFACALKTLQNEERQNPLDPALQHLFERVYRALDDPVAAAAAHLAALALEKGEPLLLYNLATGYFLHGQSKAAEKWYRVTLLADPQMAMAHQNIASILRDRGETKAADEHLHLAYSRQWLFEENGKDAELTVLMTCAAGIGNVPTRYLVPADGYNTVKCMIEYADLDGVQLPYHDVIFNIVGDPDCAAAMDGRLPEILRRSQAPVLNAPSQIDATRRDRLGKLLHGIDKVIVPTTCRVTSEDPPSPERLVQNMAHEGQSRLILRPVKSHGGQGVVLAAGAHDIEQFFAAQNKGGQPFAAYATAFHDSRDAGGRFRKYRMIYIDGVPYPYHLAISNHWLVHYFSAQKEGHDSHLEEEREFLRNPAAALGSSAYKAIHKIGERLDLAYAGVDFTILPGGEVLVFEANATMLVHPEPQDSLGAYKNEFIEPILDAFQRLLHGTRPTRPGYGAGVESSDDG